MPNPLIATPATFPNFGPWLTYAESVKSTTAIQKGIKNVPSNQQYTNMKMVYHLFYVPLCEHFGKKLPVSSFFRSEALNKAVGGSDTSAHKSGLAIDIDCDGLLSGPTNAEVFAWASANLHYDQIIAESPDQNGVPQWTHIGLKPGGNRQEKLIMKRGKDGKPIYKRIA